MSNEQVFKKKKTKQRLASPGLEPETFSVLDWRDNQLHHDTVGCIVQHDIIWADNAESNMDRNS